MALLVATWTGAKGAPTRTTPGHLVFSPSGLLPAFLEAVKAAGLSHAPVEDWGPAASMRFQDRKEAIIAILGTVASQGGYRLVSSTGTDQSSEYVWQLQDHALALGSARGTSPVGSAHESRAATPAVEPNLRLSSEHAIQASGAASQAPTPSVTPPPSAVANFVTEERALRGSGTSSGTTSSQRGVAKPAEIEVGPRLTSDASYFHGPISDADAASLLESQPAGAFLARNSSSSPASCIIISCKEGGKTLHFRLWKLSTGRFSLEKVPKEKDPVFPTLQEFVNAHPNSFKVPVEKAASGYGAFDE